MGFTSRVRKRLGKGRLWSSAGGDSGLWQSAGKGRFRSLVRCFCFEVLRGLLVLGCAGGMEGLTEKQAAFVEGVVRGGLNRVEAARVAGYSNPSTESGRLIRIPSVQSAIQRERQAVICTDGARLAWDTVEGLMRDVTAPHAVRFQASRWVLEAAGHGLAAQVAKAQGEGEKDLAGMTLGELEAFISRGREALASLKSVHPATVVEVEALPFSASEQARDV